MNRRSFVTTFSASAAGLAFGGAPKLAHARSVHPRRGVVGAVFNRAPLKPQPFAPLPLGAVKAKGWMATQLRVMADGLAGHLDEHYSLVGSDNAWLGGSGDTWERGPYWIDGLVPLAHLLDDDRLHAKTRPWIEWTLASQQPSGYFGPPDDQGRGKDEGGVQRNNSADWWPRMVMLKVLQQHHEATGDPRVPRFMARYFAYQRAKLPTQPLDHWTGWAKHRGGENTLSALWLYNRTGDASLLALAKVLVSQTSDWTAGFAAETPPSTHAVNVAMGLKQPAVAHLLDGDRSRIDAIDHGLAFLAREHGQITGMFSGDEPLHGTDPIQGTELCTVVELMLTLEQLGQMTGNVAYLDQLERIAFNALPAQATRDWMARQYFQRPNQVVINRDTEQYVQQHSGTASLVGLLDGYPCCTVNMHQGWPKLVSSLWAASADGGLAALAYAPSVAAVTVDGVPVEVEQLSAYPFEDAVRIAVRARRPVRFPIHLRVPGWATGAEIRINGQAEPQPAPGRMVRIEREWSPGDLIELTLPAQVRRSTWHKQLMGLERGPLVFALAIGEEWRKVGEKGGIASSEVHPTSPWNYALEPAASVQLERVPAVPDRPWTPEAAPLTLVTSARRVPGWTNYQHIVGTLPASPVATDAPAETVRLVPYGFTWLRMSEFPVVKA